MSFLSDVDLPSLTRWTQRIEKHTNDHKKKILLIGVIFKINSNFLFIGVMRRAEHENRWNKKSEPRVSNINFEFIQDEIIFILFSFVWFEVHVVGLGHTIMLLLEAG